MKWTLRHATACAAGGLLIWGLALPFLEESGALGWIIGYAVLGVLTYAVLAFFCGWVGKTQPLRASRANKIMACVLAAAYLLRLFLTVGSRGVESDVACFSGWARMSEEYGFSGFYTSGEFADYPPGYIYLLRIVGEVIRALEIPWGSKAALLLVVLPALACDLLLAALAWRVARRSLGENGGVAFGALFAFFPALVFNSAVWKQVDSALILALVGCMLLAQRRRWIWAAVVYAAALLLKPQAFIYGPVLAVAFLLPVFEARDLRGRLHALARAAGCGVLCILLVLAASLPFQGTQNALWLAQKYLATTSYYQYATINGFNLFAALGGNWKPQTEGWLLSWQQWGILLIVLSTVALCWLAWRGFRHNKLNLPLLCGFYGCAVFTLGHNMHERYILPALAMLAFACVMPGGRRLWRCMIAQGVLCFMNLALSYVCLKDYAILQDPGYDMAMRLLACGQVAVFFFLARLCVRYTGEGAISEPERRVSHAVGIPSGEGCLVSLPERELPAAPVRWNRRDTLYILLPTLVCAVVSFAYLGDREVPETAWQSGPDAAVTVEFGESVILSQVWAYGGIGEGALCFIGEDGAPVIDQPLVYGDIYRWKPYDLPFYGERMTIAAWDVNLNELVFVDADGATVMPVSVSPGGEALFDEQRMKPERPSQLNGMYFDELYHARTAFEHLHRLSPYENTHPPLGKLLIMAGIRMFGMNPFGWRFMGTLFGVLMVPLFYLFARKLLGRREYALLAEVLLAADCMRFTQSRIATVDVFAVFFILLMYYFMLIYWKSGHRAAFRKGLLPLALSGVAFGLGCATKWIGLYAGAGLAGLFFLSLWKQYAAFAQERRSGLSAPRQGSGATAQPERVFWRGCAVTLGWCLLFFVLVPVCIYLLSYLPYFLCAQSPYRLRDVWNLQPYMLGYHSALTATHPFESRWWSWPMILRPVWFYMGTMLPAGMTASIALLGNPVVWWGGLCGLASTIRAKLKGSRDRAATFLLVGFAAQFLPWTLITRATFLYHYFASLPFVILMLCWAAQRMEQGNPRRAWLRIALMAAAVLLFVFFYPAMSGLPVSYAWAHALEWLPRWRFYAF